MASTHLVLPGKQTRIVRDRKGRVTEKYSTMIMLEFDTFSKANPASHSKSSSIWNTGVFSQLTCL